MPGLFVFKPIEANLTRHTSILTRMNPYCSFTVGDKQVESQVCVKGGKHPMWKDSLAIMVDENQNNKMTVEVKDEAKAESIGSVTVDLNEIQASGHTSKWYPLFHNNQHAGELLIEATAEGTIPVTTATTVTTKETTQGDISKVSTVEETTTVIGATGEAVHGTTATAMLLEGQQIVEPGLSVTQKQTLDAYGNVQQSEMILEQAPIFVEQRQIVEPRTFFREIERIETIPTKRKIEVLEAHKVSKDIEYTELVPVTKKVKVMEPKVVEKIVEVMEPQVVTKTIQVVENVPVKKMVEVVEMLPVEKEVETMEPRTFMKTVELIEQVPVTKEVTVTEAVTVKESVEYVEPVITTQTITKELVQPIIVDQKVETFVGPATIVGDVVIGTKKIFEQDQKFESVAVTTKFEGSTEEKVRLFEQNIAGGAAGQVVAGGVAGQAVASTIVGVAGQQQNLVSETGMLLEEDNMVGKVVQSEVKETIIYPGNVVESDIKRTEVYTTKNTTKEAKSKTKRR